MGISAAQDRDLELAGMIVYNTNTTTGIGVHVWDGDDWIKPCTPPALGSITLSATTICSLGTTFTAKIDSVKGAECGCYCKIRHARLAAWWPRSRYLYVQCW
ncbi:MAG: hypothetical protein LBP72_08540 [Dysgonamonadaceae bacterium]|nr:hypothetical protein [Dysgonamonadaceae bacterium]